MDSRVVIQSQVNENNDEQHSHKVDSQQGMYDYITLYESHLI